MLDITKKILKSKLIERISVMENEVFVLFYVFPNRISYDEQFESIGEKCFVMIPTPEQIAKKCLEVGTNNIVMLHNHPYYRSAKTLFFKKTSPMPSGYDEITTTVYNRILASLGVTVIDHIIVSANRRYFSFHDNNMISNIA